MGVTLLRESSAIPNITNKDDAKMIRYAYGGYDGVLKNYGNMLDYSIDGGTVKLLSGRIIIQGWEVDVDPLGWELSPSGLSGSQYYTIYAEVNLLTEKAEIKAVYDTGSYPSIDLGDDLTEVSSGTARLVLYHVLITNGGVRQVSAQFEVIDYLKNLKEALLSGTIPVHTALYDKNGVDIAAKLIELEEFMTKTIYGDLTLSYAPEGIAIEAYSLQKIGNTVKVYLSFTNLVTVSVPEGDSSLILFELSVPEEFRPKKTVLVSTPYRGEVNTSQAANSLRISPGGQITFVSKHRDRESASVVYVGDDVEFEYLV